MRRGFSRVAWSFGDQALSSLTNVALTIIVARNVSASEFGTFALLMGGYLLALFVARGMTSDPLVSLHSGSGRTSLLQTATGSAGASVLGGLALGVVLLSIAAAVPEQRAAVAAFAISLPGVLLQDHVRYLNFALGEPRRAFLVDAIWATAQMVGLGVVVAVRPDDLALLILAWGLSGSIAGLAGLTMLRLRPRVRGSRSWLRSTESLWRYYTVENLLLQATNLVVLGGLALISGVAATGALRGAVTLYTPLALFAAGTTAAGVPELVRLYRRRPERVVPLALGLGVGMAMVALVWTLVLVSLPTSVGEELLGATWAASEPLLVFVGIDQIATLFVFGPFIGLRAMGRKQGMATRGLMSLVRVAGAMVGATRDGAKGASVAFAVLAPLQVVVWTAVLVRSPAPGAADGPDFERLDRTSGTGHDDGGML